MKEKHAFLIMAHSDPYLLKIQVKLLDYYKNDIYIHIDKKGVNMFNLDEIRKTTVHSNIYIYFEFNIYWGHDSQVKCELFLLEKAASKNYNYYHLLSGADLPIKSQIEIHNFFDFNKGKEFVQFYSNELILSNRKWISLYHFLQKFQKVSRFRIINLFFKNLEKLSLLFQEYVLKVNRLDKGFNFQKGATWFSITDEFAHHIIKNKEWVLKTFKFSQSSDEIFIQTLLVNSDFIKNLYHKEFDNKNIAIMRYIDWNRGFPYVFKSCDFEDLISSPYLFARKFNSSHDKKIIDRIFNHLNLNNKN